LREKLEANGVKVNFVYVHHKPNSSFPNGIPNPLLRENQSSTSEVVIKEEADFGIAFDGDFDRCFFFDHLGKFISGEHVVSLLAKVFLEKEKGSTIIHDPRVCWNTLQVVEKCGGHSVVSKTGHAFVKAAMRDNNAIYGGEISAHHYFRDFAYCDSGIIPWLLIWEILSKSSLHLADLIDNWATRFPSSGEINFTVKDSGSCMQRVKEHYLASARSFDELDGLSICFSSWRFNLRQSNTEPLVRLNIETKANITLMREKIEELKNIINK
jgi:phosphomannomutase